MVEAGGVGIFRRIENTRVIDSARRTKLKKRRNCAQLERIWNAPVEKRSGTAADW